MLVWNGDLISTSAKKAIETVYGPTWRRLEVTHSSMNGSYRCTKVGRSKKGWHIFAAETRGGEAVYFSICSAAARELTRPFGGRYFYARLDA